MANAAAPPRRVRVLIVEDEALLSILLADLVEEAGFEVLGPAMTAAEALRLAGDEPPDIAILDISLRGERDGVEVGAELIRGHGVRVIFLSGHHGVADWPEVRALLPFAVLEKPFLPGEVEKVLRAAACGCNADHG